MVENYMHPRYTPFLLESGQGDNLSDVEGGCCVGIDSGLQHFDLASVRPLEPNGRENSLKFILFVLAFGLALIT